MDARQILDSDFLDILFDGKNHGYGASGLRRQYQKRLGKSLLVMIALVLLSILFLIVGNYLGRDAALKPKPISKNLVLKQVDITQPKQPAPPPPPPAPEQLKVKPQTKYTPFNVVKDQEVKPNEEPPDLDKIKNQAISTVTKPGEVNGIDPGLVPDKGTGVVAAAPNPNKVFTSVEQMPSFPGGESALMKYLRGHISYPDIARGNGIQGVVTV